MNKNIVLLAETGSDITPEIAAKYGIYIVPMHVQLGDITKDDGSFPPEEVCEYYEKTGKVPKTSRTPGQTHSLSCILCGYNLFLPQLRYSKRKQRLYYLF